MYKWYVLLGVYAVGVIMGRLTTRVRLIVASKLVHRADELLDQCEKTREEIVEVYEKLQAEGSILREDHCSQDM